MHTKEHPHSLCNPDVITCIHIQVLIDLSQYRNYHALSACTHSPSTPQHTLTGTTPKVLTIWHISFRQKIETNLLDRNVIH